MNKLSRWWAQRTHLRQLRSVDERASPALCLTSHLIEQGLGRFSEATSQPVIPVVSELRYRGRVAVVRSPEPETLALTIDDAPYDVAVDIDPSDESVRRAVLRADGEIVARTEKTSSVEEIFAADDRLVCHTDGIFIRVADELVGTWKKPYWMSGEMTIKLTRELEPLPMLLFAATKAVRIEGKRPLQPG